MGRSRPMEVIVVAVVAFSYKHTASNTLPLSKTLQASRVSPKVLYVRTNLVVCKGLLVSKGLVVSKSLFLNKGLYVSKGLLKLYATVYL